MNKRILIYIIILILLSSCAGFFGSTTNTPSSEENLQNVPQEEPELEELSFDDLFALLGSKKALQSLEYEFREEGSEDFSISFYYVYDDMYRIFSINGIMQNEMEYNSAFFYDGDILNSIEDDYYDSYAYMNYSTIYNFHPDVQRISSIEYFDGEELYSLTYPFYDATFLSSRGYQQYNFSSGNCAAYLFNYFTAKSYYSLCLAVQGYAIQPQTNAYFDISSIQKKGDIITIRYSLSGERFAQIILLSEDEKILSYYILDTKGVVIQDAEYTYGLDDEISQIVSRTADTGQLLYRRFVWNNKESNTKSLWL